MKSHFFIPKNTLMGLNAINFINFSKFIQINLNYKIQLLLPFFIKKFSIFNFFILILENFIFVTKLSIFFLIFNYFKKFIKILSLKYILFI